MARAEFSILTPQMFYILLVLQRPLYGNQIMEEVKKLSDGEVIIGAGTLYALLPRFIDESYIRIVEEHGKMKIYEITSFGKKKLQLEIKRMQKMMMDYQEVYDEES